MVRTLGLPHPTSRGHSGSRPLRLQHETTPRGQHSETQRACGAVAEGDLLFRTLCALDMSCSNMSAIALNRHELSSGTTCHPVPPSALFRPPPRGHR